MSPAIGSAPVAPRPLLCGCSLVHQQVTRAAHASRRRGGHAAAGRASGATSRAAAPAGGVQGYSPPPPPVSPIRGLIDFHTHAAPDIFGRAVDDDELAQLAATRQMEALVFKNHVTLTADRAWLARKHASMSPASRSSRYRAEQRGGRHQPQGGGVDVDLGQTGNPTPVDGLQMFVAALMAHGITAAEIQTMGREAPGGLLMG